MNTLKRCSIWSLLAASTLAVAAPAFAQNHGGGGHYGGGHSNSGGMRAGYAAPGRFSSSGANYAGSHGGVRYSNGYSAGGRGQYGRAWRGGNWGGHYWPGYRVGFTRFLPFLPLGFATYWWGGLPYYYYDDAYYTWNASYNGYVATDPPPATDDSQPTPAADSGSAQSIPELFVYPKNGQSSEQTAKDRSECQAWAVAETGFDPTRSSSNPEGPVSNYQRAMGACLDARGYSTR